MIVQGSSPVALPFDPERASAPEEWAAVGTAVVRERSGVLLVAGRGARKERWADRCAVAIARSLSKQGRRAVLADLSFDDPRLHDLLSEPNTEGISDIFFFGASPEHLARPSSRPFDFIPAGAYVPDPRAVLEHRNWPRLIGQLEASGGLFVGYVPADSPGIASLARVIGSVILLVDESETSRVRNAIPSGVPVLAILWPRPGSPAPKPAPREEVRPAPRAVPANPPAAVEQVKSTPRKGSATSPAARTAAVPTSRKGQVAASAVAPAHDEKKPPARKTASAPASTPSLSPPAERDGVSSTARTRIVTGRSTRDGGVKTKRAPPANEKDAAKVDLVRAPRQDEREALISDLRARQRIALAHPPGGLAAERTVVEPRPIVGGPVTGEPPVATPRRPARKRIERKKVRGRNPAVLVLVAALVVSVFGGIWYFGRDAFFNRGEAVEVSGPVGQRQLTLLSGDPSANALPYSVDIGIYATLAAAVRRVEDLTRAEPSIGFFVTPVLVDNAISYRVMAGPMADSAAAAAVLNLLIRRRHRTVQTGWDIRATPYAFLLGEYDTRTEAENRMETLRSQMIPSYVIEVPYTRGPARFHLYAGAYTGPAEADMLREVLRRVGIADTLVERIGRAPPT